jgi:queuine tRNA-ribosyltransferase
VSGDPGVDVVTTRSGARAIRDRATGELMHPVVGPVVEAEHLYVVPSRLVARLGSDERAPLVLLDVGLGAGSNAIAAWKAATVARGRQLAIVSFDRTTEAMELALAGENAAAFGFDGAAGEAARALLARGAHTSPRVDWRFVRGDLPAALEDAACPPADIVFWDPFSPKANPSLWTASAFAALRARCGPTATVHTYSSATSVRAALLLGGFAVGVGETLPGSPTPKPTTVAAVRPEDLERPLDRRWLERLRRSSAPFPPDAPPDAFARAAASPQFA